MVATTTEQVNLLLDLLFAFASKLIKFQADSAREYHRQYVPSATSRMCYTLNYFPNLVSCSLAISLFMIV